MCVPNCPNMPYNLLDVGSLKGIKNDDDDNVGLIDQKGRLFPLVKFID